MTCLATTRNRSEHPWHAPAAELIVREGKTLREAATQLGVPIGSDEATATYRNKSFQRVLRTERNRFFIEIAENPDRTKAAAIGQLLFSIEKLADAGEHSNVVEAILKLARIEKWIGSENQTDVTLQLGLTAKEIDDARTKLREAAQGTQSIQA